MQLCSTEKKEEEDGEQEAKQEKGNAFRHLEDSAVSQKVEGNHTEEKTWRRHERKEEERARQNKSSG